MESCKRDEPCCDATNPECPNYDPCYGKVLPSAGFKMFDGFLHDGNYVYWEDVVFKGFDVNLTSELNDVEYAHTWYIGSEVFHTQNPPTRRYEEVPRPATISVSHVIRYEPDTVCFPDDDGYDSVVQSFYLIERWDELGTMGTFRGVIDNELDSFELGFYMCEMVSGEIVDEFINDWTKNYRMTVNFHNLGDTISNAYPFLNQFTNYGEVGLVNSGGVFVGNTTGNINVLEDNRIKMQYRVRSNDYNHMPDTLWHTFIGRKLP